MIVQGHEISDDWVFFKHRAMLKMEKEFPSKIWGGATLEALWRHLRTMMSEPIAKEAAKRIVTLWVKEGKARRLTRGRFQVCLPYGNL